jgi:hypothetical protein
MTGSTGSSHVWEAAGGALGRQLTGLPKRGRRVDHSVLGLIKYLSHCDAATKLGVLNEDGRAAVPCLPLTRRCKPELPLAGSSR